MEQTFGTACHGAGRVMSRTAAVKHAQGRRIDEELAAQGHHRPRPQLEGPGRGAARRLQGRRSRRRSRPPRRPGPQSRPHAADRRGQGIDCRVATIHRVQTGGIDEPDSSQASPNPIIPSCRSSPSGGVRTRTIRGRWSGRSCCRAWRRLRWAASSYNEQPWTYILAERTDAAAFAQALDCLVEGNRAWAKNAGVLMLSVVSRNFTKNGKPNRAAEHDMGLAAGNMVLQATALGLQAHQMIGIEPAKVRAAYKVPDGARSAHGHRPRLSGRRAAGHVPTRSASATLTPRTRRPLSEIVISGTGGSLRS